jgi:hypothetical protein
MTLLRWLRLQGSKKKRSVRTRLLGVIDDRDFDRGRLRFQLEAQLGRERIEHARACVFTWKSINGATQTKVEGAGQARAVIDRPAGNAAQAVAELSQAAEPAQLGGVAGCGLNAEVGVKFEGRGDRLVERRQLGAALFRERARTLARSSTRDAISA